MKNILSIALSLSLLLVLTSFTSEPNPRQKGWEYLGKRVVNWGLDKDVIAVGPNAVGYTKLKIRVTGGAVNMRKMVVTYGNGDKDNIPLQFHFHKGEDSRVIDLKGGKRQIKNITFWYDTKNRSKTKAIVHVAGKKGF